MQKSDERHDHSLDDFQFAETGEEYTVPIMKIAFLPSG